MDNVLALEEDVAEDVEADALVGLDAAEAGAGAGGDGGVVDELSGNGLGDAADGDGEVGKSGRAGEYVTTLSAVDLGAADLRVVGAGNGRVDVDQSCASVNNAIDAGLDGSGSADGVAVSGEAPETLAVVDGHVGDGTSVLGGVDEAEVIGTSGVVLEVDSEELLSKRGLDGVEESLLSNRRDSVDAAESQSEKTVSVTVLGELGRDRCRGLNGLRSGSHTSNGHLVSVDLTGRTGAVTVADLP